MGASFDGENFAVCIIVFILLMLFFFGSNDIGTLSGTPTKVALEDI